MPLYENLDILKNQEFLEECRARIQPFKWLFLFLVLILLILLPIGFGFLSLLVGMGGAGLTFELDETRDKPDAFERLVQENEKLKEELDELKKSRLFKVRKAFSHKK